MAEEELTEVFSCRDPLLAQSAIDEVLEPAGIDAYIHNRMSQAFPAPASMPGGYFIAVPEGRAAEAVALLREAQQTGVFAGDGEAAIAESAATPRSRPA